MRSGGQRLTERSGAHLEFPKGRVHRMDFRCYLVITCPRDRPVGRAPPFLRWASLPSLETSLSCSGRCSKMRSSRNLQNMLVGVTATLLVGAQLAPTRDLDARFAFIGGRATDSTKSVKDSATVRGLAVVAAKTKAAVAVLGSFVRPLSHPKALEDAFQSYFAFKAAHQDEVQQPYLYFADYGLPSSTPRGYLF